MEDGCHSLVMRWLLGTLLASSPRLRHRNVVAFGESGPQLANEEYEALAGVWRTYLEFDGRHNAEFSLHLAPGGTLHSVDKLPYNLCDAGEGLSLIHI